MNSRLFSGLLFKLSVPVVLLVCLLSVQQAKADYTEDAADRFYQALAPYGNWVHHRTYGRVWYPRQVRRDWRPYTDGYWAYTVEYGWLWVSDWVWGWAPFHYGRWAWDDWYGWIWVPGTVWAPAWVFWRYGGGYASWAPIPPQYIWNPYAFYSYSPPYYLDYERYVPWYCWVSVHERDFPVRHKPRRLIAPDRNLEILKSTRPIQPLTVVNNTPVNQGIPVTIVEKAAGKRFKAISPKVLTESGLPDQRGKTKNTRELIIYRPVDSKPTPDTIRREELKARQIAERVRMQPDVLPGRHGEPAELSERRVPGRLSGKPMPLEYQDSGVPIPIVPERSRPTSPFLMIPEELPIAPDGSGNERRPQADGTARIGQPPRDDAERSRQLQELELQRRNEQQRLERELMDQLKTQSQQLELERQRQAEQRRMERDEARQQEGMNRRLQHSPEQQQTEKLRWQRDAARQQEEINRRLQFELEQQQQAEQRRLERESAQQEKLIRQQRLELDLEKQREAEVHRMEREASQQREEMNRRQLQELERQRQAEVYRMQREADQLQEDTTRRQRLDLERQQQFERQRMEQESMHQQQEEYYRQQETQQQRMEMEQTEQEQRSRLGGRQQREYTPQQDIDNGQRQPEPDGRGRGSRIVIRGDRNR